MLLSFSKRLPASLETTPIAHRIHEKRRAQSRILDLTESNPTQAGLDYSPDLLATLAGPRALTYAPQAAGLLSAREAVSSYYGGRIPPERLLLTASTSEAYSYLFKLLADPGDEVLIPRPSYPLFEHLAALESVAVKQYRLEYDHGWFVDLPYLEAQITPRTRAIVVVNPNNPTGSFLKRAEFARLLELCATHGLALISDEVFADYAFAPDDDRVTCAALTAGALTFSLSGLSKVCGLPQLKLGWIAVNGPAGLLGPALDRLELIADTFLSVATPVQHALPALLESRHSIQRQIRARTRQNVESLGDRALRVEGGWNAVVRMPRIRTEDEWVIELLDRHGVLVQPGYFYDFEAEAFLVLSLLTDPAIFREGVSHL